MNISLDDTRAVDGPMNRGVVLKFGALAAAGLALIAIVLIVPDPLAALRAHDVAFHRNAGLFFEARNLGELAIDNYGEALRGNPEDSEVYARRGRLLLAANRTGAASHDLAIALKLDPGNATALRARAELVVDADAASGQQPTARRRERLEQALTGLDTAMRSERSNADLLLRAQILTALGRYEEAVDSFRRIDFAALRKAGSIAAGVEQHGRRRKQATVSGSGKYDAPIAEVAQRYARELQSFARYAEAVDVLTIAVDNVTPTAALYSLRSDARLLAGDRAGAVEDLEAALRLAPKDPMLSELLAQAKQGG